MGEFRFEAFGSRDVGGFSSGEAALDSYLAVAAKDDVARKLSSVYLAIDVETDRIAGFYAVSSHSIMRADLSGRLRGKYPYPLLPAFLIGQLARDLTFRGKGVGEVLLLDALERCYRLTSAIGGIAVVVEAIDDRAVAFYACYGFRTLGDGNRRLFLPMRTVEKLFRAV